MAFVQEDMCFSDWLRIHQDLNFPESDVRLVKDRLNLELSSSYCFRYLEGSSRKSPRFRSSEGNSFIVQYLGGHRYLARSSIKTSSTANDFLKNPPKTQSPELIKFFLFDEIASPSQNPKVVFEWRLSQGHPRSGRSSLDSASSGWQTSISPRDPSSTVEVLVSLGTCVRFACYVSCRKRFVVVVGPPCLNGAKDDGKRSNQPANCIFDAKQETMKVLHLTGGFEARESERWAVNVVFDPRPNREPVAAVIASRTRFQCLSRSGQTGSLVLYDFRRERVLHELGDRLCLSTDLQYTCFGEQLLTSLIDDDVGGSESSVDDVIARRGWSRRIVMLSADDLTVLRLLPVFPLTSVMTSVVSSDRRKMALFVRKDVNNNFADYGSWRKSPTGKDILQCLDSSTDVILIHFPATAFSLQRFCVAAVLKAIRKPEMVKSLLFPGAVVDQLREYDEFVKMR